MNKTCSMCHKDKDTKEFYKHKSCKHGVSNICKECDKRKGRAYAKGEPTARCIPKDTHLAASCAVRYSLQCDSIIEGEKFCSICHTSKQLGNFTKDSKTNKYGIVCKECKSKKYSGRYKNYYKEKYKLNREKILTSRKLYRISNRDKINAAAKRAWVKIAKQISARMKEIFKAKSIPCSYQASFSIKELKTHIESKMRTGMTWDNYGEWCVDHIKPICLWDLGDQEQRMLVNKIDNLQCLWLKENESKGKNYDPGHPMGWKGLNDLLSEEDKTLLRERFDYPL